MYFLWELALAFCILKQNYLKISTAATFFTFVLIVYKSFKHTFSLLLIIQNANIINGCGRMVPNCSFMKVFFARICSPNNSSPDCSMYTRKYFDVIHMLYQRIYKDGI